MVMRGSVAKSNGRAGSATARVDGIHHAMQRVADDRGMLVQLLFHEVAEVALADGRTGQAGQLHLALHLGAAHVEEVRALAIDHRPVAVVQIRDALGQRRQREAVGSDEHLVLAEAHRERCAVLRADDQLGMAGEDHGQRIRALQPTERSARRLHRRHAALQVEIDKLGDSFGVGLGLEFLAGRFEFHAQFCVVLDDAVVHDGHARGAVRVRVALGRRAVRRPARVTDAGGAGQRRAIQCGGEVAELALGAAALDVAVHQRGDAGAVIAAVLQTAQ